MTALDIRRWTGGRWSKLNSPERLAFAGVLSTPILLLLDYRGHTGFWTDHVLFKAYGYGGAVFGYDEVFGLTQLVWFVLAIAALGRRSTRRGFRSATTICLLGLSALVFAVTAVNGGIDEFAVHALATSLLPVVASAIVLLNPAIRLSILRIAIAGFGVLVALVVAATIARDARGTLNSPPTISNYVTNSSFEQGTDLWFKYANPPAVARLTDVRGGQDGRREAEIVGRNPSSSIRKISGFASSFPATPGDSYYIRAVVSGIGTRLRPISLGLWHADGAINQLGMRSAARGALDLRRRGTALLEGIYTPPAGAATERVAPAIWQKVPPRGRVTFRFDAVLAGPSTQPHVFRAVSSGPAPNTTLQDRFAVVLFCCGPTYTSASLASLAVLSIAGFEADLVGLIVILTLVAGLLLTRTRGGVLGGAVGAVVAIGTTGRRRWIVVALTVATVIVFALTTGRSFTTLNDSSNRIRTVQLRHHMTLFLHRPLVGYGVSHSQVHNVQASDETFIGLADAGGIPAVLLWLAAWFWPALRCLSKTRSLTGMVAVGAIAVWFVTWVTTGNEVLFGAPGTNLLPLVLAVAVARKASLAHNEDPL